MRNTKKIRKGIFDFPITETPDHKQVLSKTGILLRYYETYNYYPEFGATTINIICPFCGSSVLAYVWSLAGCGKKCDNCPAVHASFGQSMIKLNENEFELCKKVFPKTEIL